MMGHPVSSDTMFFSIAIKAAFVTYNNNNMVLQMAMARFVLANQAKF
jgi:hypothetical protein